jgi:hypothetical protein
VNDLAQRIHAVVAKHTVFATPIVTAQCKHLKKTPDTIDRSDLPKLASYIGKAVGLFSNPETARSVETAINSL